MDEAVDPTLWYFAYGSNLDPGTFLGRRRMRPLETRFRYAFIRTYKPVLDDAPYRAFETMAAYRRWCEESLPAWLGYGRV